MDSVKKIRVEVVYALPAQQKLISIDVLAGSTIEEVIRLSGIRDFFPEMEIKKVGVFGQLKSLLDVVQEGDRIEIYRPLVMDPKEARRKRVKKKEA